MEHYCQALPGGVDCGKIAHNFIEVVRKDGEVEKLWLCAEHADRCDEYLTVI